MKRWIVALVLSLLLLGGCIEYHENLDLYEDGSGELTILMGFDLAMMEMFSYEEDEEDEMDMNMGLDLVENLPDMEGVSIIVGESYQEDGWEWSNVSISFESIEHLQALSEIEDDEVEESFIGELSWSRGEDGHYIFSRVLPLYGEGHNGDMDEMTRDMVVSFFGDVTFVYSVTFPRAVLEANTESENIDATSNTVTWSFLLPDLVMSNLEMWAKIAR